MATVEQFTFFKEFYDKGFFGRKRIFTNYTSVTESNLLKLIHDNYHIMKNNSRQIVELKEFLRGCQPILDRPNDLISDVNNKNVNNISWAMVRDIANFVYNKAWSYSNWERDDKFADDISKMARYIFKSSDRLKNYNMGYDLIVGGVAYQCVLTNPKYPAKSPIPFDLSNIESENGFFIQTTALGNDIVLTGIFGTKTVKLKDNGEAEINTIQCFTDDYVYFLEERTLDEKIELPEDGADYQWKIADKRRHRNKTNPISVFENNKFLIGELELIVPLQNALNKAVSEWDDDIEKYVRALLVLLGVDADDEKDDSGQSDIDRIFDSARKGVLVLPPNSNKTNIDAKFIYTQINIDNIYKFIGHLEYYMQYISGAPAVQSKASGGDTGDAVKFREGWETLDLIAEIKELFFERTKNLQIGNIIHIMQRYNLVSQDMSEIDVDITPNRNRTSNMYNKVTTLSTLIKTKVMTPEDALITVALTTNEREKILRGKKYWDDVYMQEIQGELIKKGMPANEVPKLSDIVAKFKGSNNAEQTSD